MKSNSSYWGHTAAAERSGQRRPPCCVKDHTLSPSSPQMRLPQCREKKKRRAAFGTLLCYTPGSREGPSDKLHVAKARLWFRLVEMHGSYEWDFAKAR